MTLGFVKCYTRAKYRYMDKKTRLFSGLLRVLSTSNLFAHCAASFDDVFPSYAQDLTKYTNIKACDYARISLTMIVFIIRK